MFAYASAIRTATGKAEINESRAVQQYGVAQNVFVWTRLMLVFCINNETEGKLCVCVGGGGSILRDQPARLQVQ
jgi:uncharacterized integral membrane protein